MRSRLALTLCILLAGAASAQFEELEVDGWGFAIADFGSDAPAFSNRTYLWKEVPEAFSGWQFTQVAGGERACVEFTAPADGAVYMAAHVNYTKSPAPGWTPVEGASFHYTDKGASKMAVFRKECTAGERVVVPQYGWAGGLLLAPRLAMGEAMEPVYPDPPGVVIDTSLEPQTVYFGCPSIAILPDGAYVASHSYFGKGTTNNRSVVFASKDRGETWTKLTEIDGQWWSTLFVHKGALYIIGTSGRYGNTVIRRSADGGKTWTSPEDASTGLLLGDGEYHCAPVPILIHNGRLWRAMEDARGPGGWGSHFRSFVMSVPVDADLLNAANWTFSNRLEFNPEWFEADNPGWLEGNTVATPDGEVLNILRFNDDRGDRAAVVHVSADGTKASFDPKADFIDFPGGRTKFTIRFDPETKRYWSLVNKQLDPPANRNILALTSSAGLLHWRVEKTILHHPDTQNHAFQYVDWLFDGPDMIAVSRTAWGNAHNFHDANYLTFHRIKDFRTLGQE